VYETWRQNTSLRAVAFFIQAPQAMTMACHDHEVCFRSVLAPSLTVARVHPIPWEPHARMDE
jgi:hypothetical protein